PLMRTVNTDWGSRVPVMHFSVICCNRIGLLPQRGQVVFHENETASIDTGILGAVIAGIIVWLLHVYARIRETEQQLGLENVP
ncbi:hypothetical protein Q6249_29090, partial [Klebsiella pneumoniae]|uniref:hypothetical protein n=1 Tax=Klebsiella pneumoniae TaxID=573 RepID=UPI00272F8F81